MNLISKVIPSLIAVSILIVASVGCTEDKIAVKWQKMPTEASITITVPTPTTTPSIIPSPSPHHAHHSGGGGAYTVIEGKVIPTPEPTPTLIKEPTIGATPTPIPTSEACASCTECGENGTNADGYECPPDNNNDPTEPAIEPCQPFPICMPTAPPPGSDGTDINEPPPDCE